MIQPQQSLREVDLLTGKSRYGRKIATRALYRNISITGPCSDHGIEDRMRRMSLLCRTLSENRALARQIRTLDVYLDVLDGVVLHLPPPLDVNCLRMMVEADLGLTSAQQEKFWEWLERARGSGMFNPDDDEHMEVDDEEDPDNSGMLGPEAYLGILVVACPQLQQLTLAGYYSRLAIIADLDECLRWGSTPSNTTHQAYLDGLGNLSEIYLSNWGDEFEHAPPTSAEQVIAVLAWSGLRTLKIRNLNDSMTAFAEMDAETGSKLDRLQIESAPVEESDHLVLLSACSKLKSLHLTWSEDSDVYRKAQWRELAQALLDNNPWLAELRLDMAHQPGLRDRLTIDAEHWNVMDQAERDQEFAVNNTGLGDLKGLRHLRKLAAPKIALFGVFDDETERDQDWTLEAILPRSIEEVEIFCEGEEFTEDDKELLTANNTHALKDITIFNCTRTKWISRTHGEGSAEVV